MPPSVCPTSKTRHTAGCVICRASRTSLRMRASGTVDDFQRDIGLRGRSSARQTLHSARPSRAIIRRPANPPGTNTRPTPRRSRRRPRRRETPTAIRPPAGNVIAAGFRHKGATLGHQRASVEKRVLRALWIDDIWDGGKSSRSAIRAGLLQTGVGAPRGNKPRAPARCPATSPAAQRAEATGCATDTTAARPRCPVLPRNWRWRRASGYPA
jgi:hypothetical protein